MSLQISCETRLPRGSRDIRNSFGYGPERHILKLSRLCLGARPPRLLVAYLVASSGLFGSSVSGILIKTSYFPLSMYADAILVA